jgi:hypothetical protein
MVRIHLFLTIAWLLFAIPVLATDLRNSVPLLVFISIYANVAGHWSSWQAARVEENQAKVEKELAKEKVQYKQSEKKIVKEAVKEASNE